jgi:amino acid transporter
MSTEVPPRAPGTREAPPTAAVAVEPLEPEHGLRKGALGLPGLLAQSVANMAPAAAMGSLPALVFGFAGNGTWLSWLIALISMLLVGYCIVQFAVRYATAGSFYVYAAKSFGPVGGLLAGWGLLIGYVATGMATVIGFGLYLGAFLNQLGLPGTNPWTQDFLYLVGIALPLYLTYRDIRLSANTELVLQILSAAVVALLVLIVWINRGPISGNILSLHGTTPNMIGLGVVLAIFSFVGFESSASLGLEARNPFRAIPRAVLWSCALVGMFYVIVSYSEVLGFAGQKTALNQTTAPLNDLAGVIGANWLAWAINLGVAFSMFACTMACLNGGARMLYSMGKDGLVSTVMGRAHGVHQTPHLALWVCAPLMWVIPAALVRFGSTPLNTIGYTGTIATFGFMLGYFMVSASAPVYLDRIRQRKATVWAAGVIAGLAMLIAFLFQTPLAGIIGVPVAFPYNLFPWIFIAYVLIGLVWYFVVRARHPELSRRLGSLFEVRPEEVEAGRRQRELI